MKSDVNIGINGYPCSILQKVHNNYVNKKILPRWLVMFLGRNCFLRLFEFRSN